MADVDTVNDIIQHIDKLRHHCRDGQLEQQLSYRRHAEHFFVVTHIFTSEHKLYEF